MTESKNPHSVKSHDKLAGLWLSLWEAMITHWSVSGRKGSQEKKVYLSLRAIFAPEQKASELTISNRVLEISF